MSETECVRHSWMVHTGSGKAYCRNCPVKLDHDEIEYKINEAEALGRFWETISESLFSGYNFDPSDIFEDAKEAGLLVYEQYDPQGRHEGLNIPEVIEGDYFYLRKEVADRLDVEEAQDD